MWRKILSRISGLRRYRYVNLSDNSNVVSNSLRGRAGPPDLNSVLRSRAAHEAVTESRQVTGWVPTTHMTADKGTRPDALGRLSLERPLFILPHLIIEIF